MEGGRDRQWHHADGHRAASGHQADTGWAGMGHTLGGHSITVSSGEGSGLGRSEEAFAPRLGRLGGYRRGWSQGWQENTDRKSSRSGVSQASVWTQPPHAGRSGLRRKTGGCHDPRRSQPARAVRASRPGSRGGVLGGPQTASSPAGPLLLHF